MVLYWVHGHRELETWDILTWMAGGRFLGSETKMIRPVRRRSPRTSWGAPKRGKWVAVSCRPNAHVSQVPTLLAGMVRYPLSEGGVGGLTARR